MQRMKELIYGKPEAPDLTSEKYLPGSELHATFINAKLKDFTEKYNLLYGVDTRVGAGIAATTLLFVRGWLGLFTVIPAYVGVYYAALQYYDRSKLQTDFDQSLDELYSIYVWCAKGQTPQITHDANYLALLEAIMPCTDNSHELIPWPLTMENRREFSDRYIQILMQSPQRLEMLINKPKAQTSSLPQWLSGFTQLFVKPDEVPAQLKLLDPQQVYGNRWYQFFATTAANAKLARYGHQFDREKSEGMLRIKG